MFRMISRLFKRFQRAFRRPVASNAPTSPLIGFMAQYDDITGDAVVDTLLKRYARVYRTGNGGKWIAMLTGASVSIHDYKWDVEIDDAIQYAEDNNMRYYYHTLLWSKSDYFPTSANVPGGTYNLSTRTTRDASNNAHIDAVVGRFTGRVAYWDVWNEVIDGTGNIEANPAGTDLTVTEIGDIYDRVHALDPNAVLLYNDFGGEKASTRQNGIYTLCSDLLDAGHALHGVGLQFHIDLDGTEPTYAELLATFQRFRSLNGGTFRVLVSELDLSVSTITGTAAKRAAQAAFIKDLCRAAREAGVEAVLWWGTTNQYSWLYARDATAQPDEEPLPFEDDGTAKSVWTTMVQYI
jgi:endo-1,4-beta-xylanase